MESVLILDTETNGLDPAKGAKVIEIGAMLFNLKYRQVIQTFSTLLETSDNACENINHINASWTQVTKAESQALDYLGDMASAAHAIVAHNAQFDKKFMETLQMNVHFMATPWICTKMDFKWPLHLYRYRLQDICEAMGVPYVDAHRALADCNLLVKCFEKIEDIEARMENALKFGSGNRFANSNRFRNEAV